MVCNSFCVKYLRSLPATPLPMARSTAAAFSDWDNGFSATAPPKSSKSIMVFPLCPHPGSGFSRAQHFRHFHAEPRVVVFENGDLALADPPPIDHDLDRFPDLLVESDGGTFLEVHQARDLHPARAEHDLDVDRDIHDKVDIGGQSAARLLHACRGRFVSEFSRAETLVFEVACAEIRPAEVTCAEIAAAEGRAAYIRTEFAAKSRRIGRRKVASDIAEIV